MTGIILANPSVDFQVHNSQFLIAHFHNMLVPGTLFGLLAGYHMWFPKAFGFRLHERWGMFSALCFIVGFVLAFFPLYGAGLLGYPRRTLAYFDPIYQPYMLVALLGALVILAGFGGLVIQLLVSIRRREQLAVPAGDPWDGRSLEWWCPAPPPEYNFPVLPVVSGRDPFTTAKETGAAYRAPASFADIKMPKNSAMGMIMCVCGFLAAFGLVWYIWWLVVASTLVIAAALVGRGFARDTERTIPAHEVERNHLRWLAMVAATRPVTRAAEVTPSNAGLAVLESVE
jgi:cytochrome o ubiquinol oxidase subunit 1